MPRQSTYTHTGASNVRGNLWYNGAGQVFQRWNDNSSTGIWADSLYRYIYDGALAQEHLIDADEVASAWVYTYNRINTDYLRKPDGPREKVTSDGTNFTDRFLLQDGANISARIIRQTDNKVERMELTSSGDRQSGGSEQDTQVSKLGLGGGFIEGYASSSGITAFFDPLIQRGGRHMLSGSSRWLNLKGNNSQAVGPPAAADVLESTESPSFNWPPPRLPESTGDCQAYWEAINLCHEGAPSCIKDWQELPDRYGGVKDRHDKGWFPFCCLPDCVRLGRSTIAEPFAVSWCDEPYGRECGCDHCQWTFGFSGLCSVHPDRPITKRHIIDSSCGGEYTQFLAQAIHAYFKACEAAQCCSCNLWRIREFGTQAGDSLESAFGNGAMLNQSWQSMMGCLSEICRGERQITFICARKKHMDDIGWLPCYAMGGALAWAYQGGNTIAICVDNIDPVGCNVNTMIHEMMHCCGAAHNYVEARDTGKLGLADFCVPDTGPTCGCVSNYSRSNHPCVLNKETVVDPCEAYGPPSIQEIQAFIEEYW